LDEPSSLSFNLTESPWIKAGTLYKVHDLWSETEDFVALRNISFEDVPPHGVKALLLTDAGDEPDVSDIFYAMT
jgi:alpha-galactosidase